MTEVLTPLALIDLLAARGAGDAVASVRGEALESWSGARLADKARRLACGLLAAGLAPGEPVVIYAANRPEWVIARLAIGAAGGLPVPLDDLLPESDVEPFVRDSGCRRVFTSREHLAGLRECCADLELAYTLLDAADEGEDAELAWSALVAEEIRPLPEFAPDAPAMVVYTSGTTGRPKSFCLSHANLTANVRTMVAQALVGPGDRVLLPLPMDNVYPTAVGLLTPLVAGATVCFPEAMTGPQIVKALRVSEARLLIGVPRLYAALVAGLEARVAARGKLAQRLFRTLLALSIAVNRRFGKRIGRRLFAGVHRQLAPKLEMLVSGGARLEPDLVWTLEGLGWEMFSGYGLAEVGSVYTANFPGYKKIGTEGKPIHGPGSLRIAEPDAEGIGEIQLKGPSVFAGYRDNPEANAAAFTEDGWFRTGDLGRLDEDGRILITGRAKEMIVLGGGKNVFPEEVEKVLSASPFIQELALLERQGALVALVVPETDAIEASGSTRVDDVIRVEVAARAQSLPSFQRPTGYALWREPLPRTRLGKFRRFLLPELYAQAQEGTQRVAEEDLSDGDRALLAGSPVREIWDLLKARYPNKPLRLDANPQLDLGIDSIEWLGVTLELDDRFGIKLSEDEVGAVADLRGFLTLVAEAAARGAAAPRAEAGAVDVASERWLAPPGPALTALGRLLLGLNALVVRVLFRLRVDGAAQLPGGPPCLFIANHASDLDPLVLAAAIPSRHRRQLYWGGDIVRLFKGPLLHALARALHVFPVDERQPAASLGRAAEVLARGHALAWFPEAWRSPDGELQDFLPGVGRVIADYEGPIVPVLISGSFEAMPRWRRLPRLHPIAVRFGAAVEAASLRDDGSGEAAYRSVAARLRERVAALRVR